MTSKMMRSSAPNTDIHLRPPFGRANSPSTTPALRRHTSGPDADRGDLRSLCRPHHEPAVRLRQRLTFPLRSIDSRRSSLSLTLATTLLGPPASGECQPKSNLPSCGLGADRLEGDRAGAATVEVVLASERDLGLLAARLTSFTLARRRSRRSWRSAGLGSSSVGAGGARRARTCSSRGASARRT